MAQQDAFALGRSKLNGFLFADIGIERSGMTLSVISALARQGLDPWLEAGRLAKLPRKAATDGLARLIAAMPASVWPLPAATAIATRLVGLLPRQEVGPLQPSTASASKTARPASPWLIAAILIMAMLGVIAAYIAPAPNGPAAPAAPTAAKVAPLAPAPIRN